MKYLYLFLFCMLVNSECPNLCSGHGSCLKNGVCDCNRQPGLGINKGASDEVIWTGADCSERLCPKGQSYTYYDFTPKSEGEANVQSKLKKLNVDTTRRRQLFESDRELDGTDDATPDPSVPVVTTTAAPTTEAATTPKPTTTSPPIITEAPITMPNTPPAPTIPEAVKKQSIAEALEIFETENIEAIQSYTIACYKGESGTFLGNMVATKPNETNVGELLGTLGITTVDEDIYCGTVRIKRKEEKSPSVDLLKAFSNAVPSKKEDFYKADGRKVKTEVVKVALNDFDGADKIREKLNLKKSGAGGGRMLADGCTPGDDKENRIGQFYCIESEDPSVSFYYRMKQTTINVKCEGTSTSDGVYNLYAPAEDINDIQGPCFFLGDENTPIESSEIYSFIGSRGGDYYFGRYNNDVTTIVAKETDETKDESSSIELDFNQVPSLVPGSETKFQYKNRPRGEIELALVKGATIEVTPYNSKDGTFGETITTTVKSFRFGEGGSSIIIESPVNNPIKPGNSTNSNEEEGTSEEGTGTDSGRMLWEERELVDDENPIYIVNILKTEGPHPFIECSGQGNCDRTTGQCQCYAGFEGDACQRTSCPNACSNNGRCVVLNEALGVSSSSTTATTEEEPFDTKLYGCICDEGHRGADCSLYECPSDEDPKSATNPGLSNEYRDCSGRGICDYESGTCTCFEGYYGTACETAATLQ